MTIAGEQPSPAVLKWVMDTVSSAPSRFGTPPIRTQAFGSAERKPAARLGIIVTNDSYVASVDSVDGRLRVVCYVISRDYEGKPLVTYGFETDARSFVEPLMDSVLSRSMLLPPSLLNGVSRDSVISVSAWAPMSFTKARTRHDSGQAL